MHLRATLTEIGTLELWCVSDVIQRAMAARIRTARSDSGRKDTVIESMPPQFAEARRHIEQMFGGKVDAGGASGHCQRQTDLAQP